MSECGSVLAHVCVGVCWLALAYSHTHSHTQVVGNTAGISGGGIELSNSGSTPNPIDFCITQLKAQGPSRTCNESKEEKKPQTPDPEP